MKLCYGALGIVLGLVLVGCKAQESDLTGKVSRSTRLTLEDRPTQGQPSLSGSALGTCLVQVVPASLTQANNLADPTQIYAQGLLDLGTQQITLTLPLDTSLRLVRKGWKGTYKLGETKPSADGVGLSEPFTVTSGTDQLSLSVPLDEAPALASQSPADGATGVALASALTLTFNNPMAATSLSTNSTGTGCTGSVQLSADNFSGCVKLGAATLDSSLKVLTVTPAAALDYSTTYKLKLTQGVTDSKGNGLGAELVNPTGFKTLSSDSTAPTIGTGTLTASSVGSSGLTLSWIAATDTTTDGTAPVVSNGTVSRSLSVSSISLSWATASDGTTATTALTYQVFYSTADNLTTAALAKANGTAANSATANLTALTLTNPGTGTYYFNVVVTDQAGNSSVYGGVSATFSALLGSHQKALRHNRPHLARIPAKLPPSRLWSRLPGPGF